MTLKAIADAIATKYVGVTATRGSTTEALVSAPTASLPDAIAATPILLVYHPTGVLDVGVSRIRRDEHDFPVRILRDPVTYPERSDWLYAWFDATRDVITAGNSLGLSYVSWANLVGSRLELDGETYAGKRFDVVEYTVRVHVGDIQAP
jgi:hypothetical protein